MRRDVASWVRTCIPCQRAKVHKHTTAPIGTYQNPDARFDHIHIDIVGPLPYSEGKQYLLTAIDRFTRWPEAFPLTDISAQSCAKTLCENWICRFGVPTRITTDRGTQFESALLSSKTIRHATHPNHSLSPIKQRNCGKIPSEAERSSEMSQCNVDRSTSISSPGDQK
jgi:hypothetical protein